MEEINSKKELKLNVEFYSETKEIILPLSYDIFVEKIRKILNLDSFSYLILTYQIEDDDDKINLKNENDYEILIRQIVEDDIKIIINIKLKEKDNLDYYKTNFIEFEEQIHQSDEINDIKNENKIDNNIINTNENSLDNNIKNDYILNEEKNILKDDEENIINDKEENNVDFNKTYLIFEHHYCVLCDQFPIIDVLYYCLSCQISICKNCEDKPLIKDKHPLLKVQTKEQYADLNKKILNKKINQQPQLQKIGNNIIYSINKIFKIKKFKQPKIMNLIQLARALYDFKDINDEQLKNVLNKTKGDINKAKILLKK